eukprot:TRINITY_DN7404_c0_g1_i1.p1 TRINITY_DN7404_c0_g1~~TRINITY_DN7404_c0_g1_i1.p1  ORF type:complete len:262 (-),score=71.03 TRINITY_DN7404_c0_g1_i1:269-1054(-)
MSELTIYPRLQNKTVFITGASAGIGLYSAIHFAACGSRLVLIARRENRLNEIKTQIQNDYGVDVYTCAVDLCDLDSFQSFVDGIPEEFKNIDIIVNNAGLALGRHKLVDYAFDDIETMMNTNVRGTIAAIKAFVPGMIERGCGHIINVGSIAGKNAYQGGSIYCATKFAVEAISDSLRQELIATPLRVTKICPGAVETEFSIVRLGDKEKADAVYQGYDPLVGEDIADNIVYVASRPQHVQIADMIIFPTAQAEATMIHKH